MAVIACPGCGLPRAADEADATPCPVCAAGPGRSFVPDPTDRRPAPVAEPSLSAARPDYRPVAAACGVGFVAGVMVVLAVQAGFAPDPPAEPRDPAPVVAVVPPPAPPVPPAPPPAPAPADPPDPEIRYVEFAPDPREMYSIDPVPPRPAGLKALKPKANTVKRTAGPYTPSGVKYPGADLTLRGWVTGLLVPDLGPWAVLDASGVGTRLVTVEGVVGEHATLRVAAGTGGRVEVHRPVGGEARIDARADAGDVQFFGEVGGGAVVNVVGKQVLFHEGVTGAGTRVMVTLTAGGTLALAGVGPGARVDYRRAAGTDPEPDVFPGEVDPAAEFRRVE